MANYSKAFNFRGGFQVDTDVLVVRGQNVGIGSTIPNERLVVDGIIQANGLNILSTEAVELAQGRAGILTVTEILDVGIEKPALFYPNGTPQVRLTTGIITAANPAIGVVTYYGDGGRLLNLPTSQWLDVDVGLGFTSIYAQGYVGVNTTDPRFVFQVGGVPFGGKAGFNTAQLGVGIESGSIWASDRVTIGGTVSIGGGISIGSTLDSSFVGSLGIGGTVSIGSTLYVAGLVTARELAGIGSQITVINADNIAIGSIGSMRYGDLIVTKRVIGDLTGTATTATSVTPDATLEFDTARADEITAISRFISTEGKLQIGPLESFNDIGDIDLLKTDGRESTIYSLSTSGSSRVFVGQERESGNNNGYGGMRFGGSNDSATSGPRDLDIVNFDVGNVNSYLHAGDFSGGTTGAFRWIYGQQDRVVAELNAEGQLIVSPDFGYVGNALVVGGGATVFANAYVGEDLSVAGNTVLTGDLDVVGTLTVNSVAAASTLTFSSAIFENEIIVGSDPTIFGAGSGAKIDSNGDIVANSLDIAGNAVILSTSGVQINSGSINALGGTIGELTSNTVTADTLQNTSGTVVIADDGSLVASTGTFDSVVIDTFNIPLGTIDGLVTDTIEVTDTITATKVVATATTTAALEITSSIDSPNLRYGPTTLIPNTLEIDNVAALGGGEVDFVDPINMNSANIGGVGVITATSIISDSCVIETPRFAQLTLENPSGDITAAVTSIVGAGFTLTSGNVTYEYGVAESSAGGTLEYYISFLDDNGNQFGSIRQTISV